MKKRSKRGEGGVEKVVVRRRRTRRMNVEEEGEKEGEDEGEEG